MELEKNHASAVLVVEDEPFLRTDLAQQLRQTGFDVIETAIADAAATLLNDVDYINVVLTEIRMPGKIDGAELVRSIRRRLSTTKIVVISAHVDPHWDMPVDAVFTKPVRIKELMGRLRQLTAAG